MTSGDSEQTAFSLCVCVSVRCKLKESARLTRVKAAKRCKRCKVVQLEKLEVQKPKELFDLVPLALVRTKERPSAHFEA